MPVRMRLLQLGRAQLRGVGTAGTLIQLHLDGESGVVGFHVLGHKLSILLENAQCEAMPLVLAQGLRDLLLECSVLRELAESSQLLQNDIIKGQFCAGQLVSLVLGHTVPRSSTLLASAMMS